jgi:ferric-dicitrate binding protein FerR (iron transport regulator)
MSEHKKKRKRLNYLFTQYAGRRIVAEELSELKTIVNVSDNEYLDEPLRLMWMNNLYSPICLPSEEQKMRMVWHIEQSIQPVTLQIHRRFIRTFSRIAAVLIFSLFTGICVYLYNANRKLSIYKNSEITLNIGNGQEAGFVLPDGTSVRLNSGSTLRYANNFGEKNRFVNIVGEAFFDVKQDKNRPFIVHTNYMDIEVLGTTFNVCAYNDNNLVEMTLLTGSVKASSTKYPENQIIVKPNEKVICNISTGKLTVQRTNIRYETAWLNGEIVFKSETLNHVLAKLERKYGVHIRYEGNPNLLEDRFSGRISKDNHIGDVMKILTDHYSLKYEQKDNTFVLSDKNK